AATVPHGTRTARWLRAVARNEIKSGTARDSRLELQTDSHATPSVGRRQSQKATTGMDVGGGSFAGNEAGPSVGAEVRPPGQRGAPSSLEEAHSTPPETVAANRRQDSRHTHGSRGRVAAGPLRDQRGMASQEAGHPAEGQGASVDARGRSVAWLETGRGVGAEVWSHCHCG